MKIILIDNYDSFTFNLYHYLSSIKNVKVDVIRNDKINSKDIIKKCDANIKISLNITPTDIAPRASKKVGIIIIKVDSLIEFELISLICMT